MTQEDLVFQLLDYCHRDVLDTLDQPYDLKLMQQDGTFCANASTTVDQENDDPFDWSAEEEVETKKASVSDLATTVCLFGKTRQGQNIVVRVKYTPYLMVEIPSQWGDTQCQSFLQALARKIHLSPQLLSYAKMHRARAYGWIPKSAQDASTVATFPCLRIRFPSEKVMRSAGYLLKKYTEFYVPYYGKFTPAVWEMNIATGFKFLDEQRTAPCSWVKIPAGTYVKTQTPAAHADVEIEITDFRQVQPLPDVSETAPFVIASVDIECCSMSQEFPVSTADPIIGVGTSIEKFGVGNSRQRHYFTWKPSQVSKQSDAIIHEAKDELGMLMAWRDWWIEVNPDIVSGYNINGFDFKYISDRVKNLTQGKANRFFYLGRMWAEQTPLESPEFSSNAFGDRSFFTFRMTGRLVLDLLENVRRERKLRDYSLEAVSKKYLKCGECRDQKEAKEKCTACQGTGQLTKMGIDHHQMYNSFFQGSDETRGYIAEYCVRDCDLVLELMAKLCTIQNLFAMSQVTITSIQDIVSAGQQIRVYNQIVWYGHQDEYNICDPQDIQLDEDGYEGAKVLDPEPGYYTEPIATLDFASLYPSIILQHNLCFSTWVKEPRYLNVPGATYETTHVAPRSYSFVTHRIGILPKIVQRLLKARKTVKAEMAQEKDAFRKSLLDAKQLAIKVATNSVYGFCGTGKKGRYPCLPVSDSTTYWGRQMITKLKATIEAKYVGSKVIYGDTDSVMVKFNVEGHPDPVRESFRLGAEVCVLAHEMFGEHISLTMEKVFRGYILLKKKRYAGLSYEDPDQPPKVKMSGVDAVRRDVALMVCVTQTQVINALLLDRSVDKAIAIIQAKLEQLVKDEIPFDEYMMSFQLKKTYKNQKQAQKVLVDRIRARAPGSEPKSGDRLQFVMVAHKDKKAPRHEKVEEAVFAREHKLPLDRLYYLEKQLERPFSDLMCAFVANPKSYFDVARSQLQNQRDKMQDIRALLKLPPKTVPLVAPRPTEMVSCLKPKAKPKTSDNVWKRKTPGGKSKGPEKNQPTLAFLKRP